MTRLFRPVALWAGWALLVAVLYAACALASVFAFGFLISTPAEGHARGELLTNAVICLIVASALGWAASWIWIRWFVDWLYGWVRSDLRGSPVLFALVAVLICLPLLLLPENGEQRLYWSHVAWVLAPPAFLIALVRAVGPRLRSALTRPAVRSTP